MVSTNQRLNYKQQTKKTNTCRYESWQQNDEENFHLQGANGRLSEHHVLPVTGREDHRTVTVYPAKHCPALLKTSYNKKRDIT